jgi:enoyl-CoA hydratase/carnithine racemase
VINRPNNGFNQVGSGNLVDEDCQGGVAILSINNPPVNALSRTLRQALLERICVSSASR